MDNFSQVLGQYIHKLNGRAGAIRSWIQIIQMDKPNLINQDKEFADMLIAIENKAIEILSFTDEFKKLILQPEENEQVSVDQLLKNVITNITIPAQVDVNLDIQNDPPKIKATKSLREVFVNLIDNAIEAMPKGGIVDIRANVNIEKNVVEISINDQGRGIPKFLLDSLFQAYTSTKEQQGHGLGLWWSKAYLTSIGGDIELVWSEVGKGTSFLVSLPLVKNDK